MEGHRLSSADYYIDFDLKEKNIAEFNNMQKEIF